MLFHRLFLFVLVEIVFSYNFTSDDWDSFDAYGLKLVANDVVVAQARNREGRFLLQFGPFVANNLTLPCYIDYPSNTSNDINFIYNIVVPHRTYDTYDGDASIIFVGENEDISSSPYPFVGHLRANSSCDFTYHIHMFVGREHDEFFIVGVDAAGEVAYGFSSEFAFSYDLQSHVVEYLPNWPIRGFVPRAVDINTDEIAVVPGYISSTENTYKPLIYLLQMNISSLIVIGTWPYLPASNSWQAGALNRDAVNFTTKHVMSVSVHHNSSQVVVGMPSINTVFWFYLSTSLTLIGSRENGYQRGYGQTVGWDDESDGPYPVILANTYFFPYEWSTSIIYWFTLPNFLSSDPVMPLFPTVQCPRWIDLGQKIISIAATTVNVAILDSLGQIYVILAAPSGTYPGTSSALGINPTFSASILCQAGMYKNWDGLDICFPCSVGTMSESEGSINCIPYNCDTTNSFCPIGSTTNDTYSDLILPISQALSYPSSPESTLFDDILIQNMFHLADSGHCLRVSPLFWTMVMVGIAGFIVLTMGALKFCHRFAKIRHVLKRIFQQIDLIKEGELWIGGLASFGLLILLGFAYNFSISYLNQYPIETSSPSTFACDSTLRNAKFTTSVQSLSIPHSEQEQPIFDLLNEQQFTLTIDFINTKFNCNVLSVTQQSHANLKSVGFTCNYNRSTVTVSVALNSHTTALNYGFDDVLSIGALRLSLYSSAKTTNHTEYNAQYLVRELHFSHTFYVNNQTMAADSSIEINLTSVVNETVPLADDGPYLYNAIWIPTSPTSTSTLFLTLEQFLYYGLLKPSISISISEMTYFVWNVQEPIAKQSEIIFHTLLFTIVCLELFGLIYLLIKLIFLPFFSLLRQFVEKHSNLVHPLHLASPPESADSYIKDEEPNQSKETIQNSTSKPTPRLAFS